METLKKLIEEKIEDTTAKGFAIVDIRETEELKELESKLCSGLILSNKSKLKALMKDCFERIDNQKEIINLLLSKLTDLVVEKLEGENLGARWDYFFNSEERRKIIDSIISEDKSKKPY